VPADCGYSWHSVHGVGSNVPDSDALCGHCPRRTGVNRAGGNATPLSLTLLLKYESSQTSSRHIAYHRGRLHTDLDTMLSSIPACEYCISVVFYKICDSKLERSPLHFTAAIIYNWASRTHSV
jgi:hypothetical protein